MMRRFGIPVLVSDDEREIGVPAGTGYRAQTIAIGGDFTSASYLLGAAFVTRGNVRVANLDADSLQGERAILDVLAELGARVRWIGGREVEVDCTGLPAEVDATLDLRDCPNILPTVAAVAATVRGRVKVTGARLTQFHKSPRVSAMAAELAKVEVPVRLIEAADGSVDGLEVRGRPVHRGGAVFSSHGDHRIYMSLALLALAGERPSTFAQAVDTADSFPDFTAALGLDGDAAGRDPGDAWPCRLSA
jgi:3-phosphoshikimate 1-carboxyvinyltransferase